MGILLSILIILVIYELVFCVIVALATIVVKKVWFKGTTTKTANNKDWAHNNVNRYAEPRQQQGSAKQKNEPKWYPTGWYWNEEKNLWEPPDYTKKEFQKGKEPTFEKWKAARQKEQQEKHPEN